MHYYMHLLCCTGLGKHRHFISCFSPLRVVFVCPSRVSRVCIPLRLVRIFMQDSHQEHNMNKICRGYAAYARTTKCVLNPGKVQINQAGYSKPGLTRQGILSLDRMFLNMPRLTRQDVLSLGRMYLNMPGLTRQDVFRARQGIPELSRVYQGLGRVCKTQMIKRAEARKSMPKFK